MLTFSPRDEAVERPSRSAAVVSAIGGLAVLTLAVVLGPASTTSSAGGVPADGRVVIDGQVYPFEPRTCLITDHGFVVSGPGQKGDQPFVASVSKMGGVQVAFGITNEVDEPEPGDLWWISGVLHQSRIEGSSVRATAMVVDRSGSVSGPRTAVVDVTCPPR